ncbi:uncharacterized protein LOC123322940 [Coccinella septempunctata]|uniref:uncharacterized protein LOC123322940 n=1 Tax=Coccinella septempunctata TaxID=41139 RepID=UPI001D0772DE|nr:uncharacterized protein LOC123322940 [Coccinella septempunctata]
MAGRDGIPPDRKDKQPSKSDSNNESEGKDQIVKLDLGDDNLRKHDNHRLGNHNTGAGTSSGDCSRREENPFSLKHFLRSDSSYQNKGARPKVYCDGRPVKSVLDTQQGQLITDNPSILPDFVQDHLVIEQSYLSNGPTQNYNAGVQLPDFAQNSFGCRQNIELNASNMETSGDIAGSIRPQADFPLDLPLNSGRPGTSNEVAVSKSLPDFLNDGAVRSQNPDNLSGSQSPEIPDRLHRELDLLRQQLTEQTNRADMLKRELEETRNQENRYKQHLIETLEQLEENLKRCNRRASTAEATVSTLRQEITLLKKENRALKAENLAWGCMEGATGGPPNQTPNHSQRLAQELRNAASSAEASLRQLLSGVDNLRLMASTLENMHRIEESNEPFLSSDENSGPAL